jgi:beta-ribofuranosylaminobenzene 5'-phosphate synthase
MGIVRVTTGSRLHFGLLRLPPSPEWPDDGTRYFGGCGLMIDEPGVVVRVERAAEWATAGPLAERALASAQRLTAALATDEPFAIHIERAPPVHVGLGTGTQLEMAVATGVSRVLDRTDDAVALARILSRGRRSAIGVHGFARGGFLIDRGKRRPTEVAAVERLEFPDNWRIVVLTPNVETYWHGDRESAAFAAINRSECPRMEELLTQAMAPALRTRDLIAFGKALGEYNALAGEFFREFQGGRYADPIIQEIVNCLRGHGAGAAGQSSWGPTVFAIAASDDQANWIMRQINTGSRPIANAWVAGARATRATTENL